MANGEDNFDTDILDLEEVAQTLKEAKKYTLSFNLVWGQMEQLVGEVRTIDRKLDDLRGSMQHLVKTRDNIQPDIMSTPNPTHLLDKPLKPIPFGNLSAITESPLHDNVTPTQPQPHFSQITTPITNTPHIATTTVPLLNLSSTNPQQDTYQSC